MRKEMPVACFRYHSSIWGGGTEEAHKHLSISGVAAGIRTRHSRTQVRSVTAQSVNTSLCALTRA
jgi:hypothetical protein